MNLADIFIAIYVILTIFIAIYMVFFGWWMFKIFGIVILCIYSFIAWMTLS
jgi:hypothetical protein